MATRVTQPYDRITADRRWIPIGRSIAAAVLAGAILTQHWFPGPTVPGWARTAGLGVAGLLLVVALVQFTADGGTSRRVAMAALTLDAATAVFLLWAYSFDP